MIVKNTHIYLNMQTTLQLSVSHKYNIINKKQEQQDETVPASDVDITENI